MTPPISRRAVLRAGAAIAGGVAAWPLLGAGTAAHASRTGAGLAAAPTLPWREANAIVAGTKLPVIPDRTFSVLDRPGLGFPGTGAWTTWQTVSLPAVLAAGANTVKVTATTANGGPNLDYLEIATG